MFIDDLKKSILQRAIQGKLVEQNPNDEPASELLRRIREEKEKLIKDGKMKKEKPLSPITDEEKPFAIPNNWERVKLGDILTITTGQKDANEGAANGIYDFFTCSAEPIKSNSFSFDGEYLIAPGNGANVGLTIYYNGKFEAYQRTYILGKIVQNFNLHFIKYVMDYNRRNYNQDKMFGSAIPYIKLGNLQNYPVPLPPLEEQERIVAKLDELMPLLDESKPLEEEIMTLEKEFPGKLRQSILQYAIQGKLVPQNNNDEPASELLKRIKEEKEKLIKDGKIKKEKPLTPITDEEKPFAIPNNWERARIPEVTHFQEGPGILAVDFRKSGVPLIRIAGMQTNIVKLEGCDYLDEEMVKQKWNHFKLDLGDIVISTSASMDKIAEVTEEAVGAIPYTGLIRFKMFTGLDKNFFKYFIQSPFYMSQVNNQKSGGFIKHYGPTHLQKMIIPLPPLEEQKRIVAKLDELLKLCDELEEQINLS